MLCDLASSVMLAVIGKDNAWAAALVTVPPLLRVIAIELVARAMANPQGAQSTSESLGAYSYTERFQDGASGGGLWLTGPEEMLLRRAVFGNMSATTMPATSLDQFMDLLEGDGINYGVAS